MSPSDAQPPLSRRQMRERERAASGGAQPVTPPPTVAATSAPEARRRPGSHVAPGSAAPAQSAVPRSASAPSGVPDQPPASATEIVPGTGGMSRRQLRLLREAQEQGGRPVPLQNPTPHSSDRTVQDVLGTLSGPAAVPAPDAQVPSLPTPAETAASSVDPERAPLVPFGFAGPADTADTADRSDDDAGQDTRAEDDGGETSHWQEPNPEVSHLDPAAVEQATAADGSPDAIEPLEAAAAHAEEPRLHRTTWAPHDADPDDLAVTDEPGTTAGTGVDDVVPAPTSAPAAAAPGVFPLDLDDDDTNEVPLPVVPADAQVSGPTSAVRPGSASAPGSASRPASSDAAREPKPVTTAFEAPSGHWSTFAHDSNDAEVHDEETGTRRVTEARSNAIILPNSALADPTGALNATGEVILTGSIDLPSSLSSTGSHRPIDGAEVDRLLDQQDEQPDTDASPVRASRAVSSHTSTRQVVLAAAKPKDSKTPVVLAVAASAVGVVAAGVIVVALVATNFFGS
ncbi:MULTISPECIES: hypothetical protein [unclassified Curtobacterium]|uniref:hypothetical protein n=1 Tax=unclassified Curtobacterium TaxID=257496 RepID=UPI000D876280|nr:MULTISPECIES: hypothetical protein [unclassified Curtobacterium]PYY34593.1 hypothetical protein DEI87_09330 [Curtobacterium sp. MCBD17_029]WIB36857.1 hypothetical protein DEJ15_07650 [Curtobacterium sp. MCJR17_043]